MWLVIRWILLPLAVGRRIHPSIGEFKRFKRIRSKKFSKAAPGPAPLSKILRLIVEFANQTMNSTANGRRIHRITNHN